MKIIRNHFILFTLFIFISKIYAGDSVSTCYKDGDFVTYNRVWVDAPEYISKKVVADFVYQTKYDLNKLFTWGLKGMNLRREKGGIIEFDFKSTTYNEKSGLVRGVGDVVVPYITTFNDICVDSRMDMTELRDGRIRVKLEVMYSDAFFKKTIGIFHLIPEKNGCWMSLETRVKFGWFFDFFITLHKYSEIMEWRFTKLVNNLKEEAELRTQIENNLSNKTSKILPK
jgi:hypothetical protein